MKKTRLGNCSLALYLSTVSLLTNFTNQVQAQELAPEVVAQIVYTGIQHIHGYQATPQLYFGVVPGQIQSSCGVVNGSLYCPADHAIFITIDHIQLAYEYGDAALAYIIAHEYAHAMQTAYGFLPNNTPISELQADCLAGFYLGVLPNVQFDTSDMLEIGGLAHKLGDFEYYHHDHHGTPQERMKAVAYGMEASKQGWPAGAQACLQ
jgi:predicted metalloprotease